MKPGYIILNLGEKNNEQRGNRKTWKHPKFATRCRSEMKALNTILSDSKGICATDTTRGRKDHQGGALQRLCSLGAEQIPHRRKARPTSGMLGIELIHDNARAHKSKLVQEYLSKESSQNIQTLPHIPYFPYLVSCDFCFRV